MNFKFKKKGVNNADETFEQDVSYTAENTEAGNASVALAKQESKARTIWRTNWEGWMFVFPLFIGLAMFTVYPMIQSLIWSLYHYEGMTYEWIGFGNFAEIFASPVFGKVFVNTIYYTFVSVPISLVTSYLLACLVNMKIKGVGAFRVIYYLPCVIPGVVGGLLWKDMFDAQGFFNTILAEFGTSSEFFTSDDPYTAISSIFLMNIWGIGGGMILWLSAFKSIPGQLYEAARIDGASRFRQLVSITIPMSMSMIFFNVVTMLVGTLQYNGTLTFASGGGKGARNALYMWGVMIYIEAFGQSNFGYASALSWVLMVFIGIITAILFGSRRFLYMGDE